MALIGFLFLVGLACLLLAPGIIGPILFAGFAVGALLVLYMMVY